MEQFCVRLRDCVPTPYSDSPLGVPLATVDHLLFFWPIPRPLGQRRRRWLTSGPTGVLNPSCEGREGNGTPTLSAELPPPFAARGTNKTERETLPRTEALVHVTPPMQAGPASLDTLAFRTEVRLAAASPPPMCWLYGTPLLGSTRKCSARDFFHPQPVDC